MRLPHLALPQRPQPDALARRWFAYFILTIVTTIIGIVLLMKSSDGPRPGSPARIGESQPSLPDTR